MCVCIRTGGGQSLMYVCVCVYLADIGIYVDQTCEFGIGFC